MCEFFYCGFSFHADPDRPPKAEHAANPPTNAPQDTQPLTYQVSDGFSTADPWPWRAPRARCRARAPPRIDYCRATEIRCAWKESEFGGWSGRLNWTLPAAWRVPAHGGTGFRTPVQRRPTRPVGVSTAPRNPRCFSACFALNCTGLPSCSSDAVRVACVRVMVVECGLHQRRPFFKQARQCDVAVTTQDE